MIVNEVDIGCLAVLEAKDDPPIRAHSDGPKTFEFTFQRMQAESWQPQRLDRFRRLQDSQNLFKFAHMLGINASRAVSG
jgi:hypothetical protein